LPEENGFSLEGRKALVQKESKLFLYEWQKPKNYLFTTKNHYSETLIKDYTNTNNFPRNTAILNNGNIVIGIIEDNLYKIKTINPNTKVEKTTKEYKIFNLDQFYKDYKAGNVSFNPEELKKQTSLQYTDKFKVLDDSTISFVDFAVSSVDSEKPTEAVAFERQVNLSTGHESTIDGERERLDLKGWGLVLKGIRGDGRMDWFLFNSSTNFSLLTIRESNSKSGLIHNQNSRVSYIDLGTVGYKTIKTYLIGNEDSCRSNGYYTPPCFNWVEDYIIQEQNNTEKKIQTSGNIWYFGNMYAVGRFLQLLNYSDDKKLIIMQHNDIFAYNTETKRYAKLYDFTLESNFDKIIYFK
jgi:hypothetical protein